MYSARAGNTATMNGWRTGILFKLVSQLRLNKNRITAVCQLPTMRCAVLRAEARRKPPLAAWGHSCPGNCRKGIIRENGCGLAAFGEGVVVGAVGFEPTTT